MNQTLPTRRTTSLTGSARLNLGVDRPIASSTPTGGIRHPLKQDYVYRPPGAKVDYEKEIRRVATFGSVESFFHLYAHLTSPADLPPVTDVLVFASRIQRPGVWEEMASGGKFTIRLLHPITPVLYETILFALIGDHFDESDSVVGIVLSVRQNEDILSVWVEEEGEAVRSGQLREKILAILDLPGSTVCEYRSNRALMDAASSLNQREEPPHVAAAYGHGHAAHAHGHQSHGSHSHQANAHAGGFGAAAHGHGHASHGYGVHGERSHHRGGHGERAEREDGGERRNGWAQRREREVR